MSHTLLSLPLRTLYLSPQTFLFQLDGGVVSVLQIFSAPFFAYCANALFSEALFIDALSTRFSIDWSFPPVTGNEANEPRRD